MPAPQPDLLVHVALAHAERLPGTQGECSRSVQERRLRYWSPTNGRRDQMRLTRSSKSGALQPSSGWHARQSRTPHALFASSRCGDLESGVSPQLIRRGFLRAWLSRVGAPVVPGGDAGERARHKRLLRWHRYARARSLIGRMRAGKPADQEKPIAATSEENR